MAESNNMTNNGDSLNYSKDECNDAACINCVNTNDMPIPVSKGLVESEEHVHSFGVCNDGDCEAGSHSKATHVPVSVNAKKLNKKRKKGSSVPKSDAADVEGAVSNQGNIHNEIAKLESALKLVTRQEPSNQPVKRIADAKHKTYKFWETQPVVGFDEKVAENCVIEEDKEVAEIRHEPYTLPSGFVWDTLNIDDDDVLKELYVLLNENYVEDDDQMFRFDYSQGFLRWALQPPGCRPEWYCGIRAAATRKLIGFISAIPATVVVYKVRRRMVEINFLCVHKKLRSKRVAPVLIKEITRRVNLAGCFQAVYTAGVILPRPLATCRYWHRSLNPKKLIDIKFSHLARNMTIQRTLKLYRLPELPSTSGVRELRESDVPQCCLLLNDYLQQFNLVPQFDADEFRHWFVPKSEIIYSFVVCQDDKITDFISFYSLPSTVMSHPVYNVLSAAYSFYNVSTRTPIPVLMNDALILAKNLGFDVFNALDLMQNKEFLEQLKFGIGDGNLQYYLFNWKCPAMDVSKVGLVLQ